MEDKFAFTVFVKWVNKISSNDGIKKKYLYICKRFCHEEGQGNKNHIEQNMAHT